MKKFIFALFGIALLHPCYSQTADSAVLSTDKNIRNKVLSDIQDNLDKKSKTIDLTLSRLDHKVDSLDIEIAASRDARDKADKLLQRVQALEVKLNALNDTFDGAFDPTEYINSATRMYLVN